MCNLGLCLGPLVNPGLDLAAGGSATIEILGTPDPLAAEGSVLGFLTQAFVSPAIGGTSDPNGSNDNVLYSQTVAHESDLVAVSLVPVLESATSVRIDLSFRNDGPSAASDIRTTIGLPSGYQIDTWACDQAYSGFSKSANQLVVSGTGSAGNGSPMTCALAASFSAPQPVGNATLLLEHGSGSSATDPDGGNNFLGVAIPTSPPPQDDAIFGDGFE